MQDIKGLDISNTCLRFPCERIRQKGETEVSEILVQLQEKEGAVRVQNLKAIETKL